MLSAYIMPHAPIARPAVGRGEEKKIQKTLDSYRSASRKIAQEKPETIIIISPHNVMYRDAFYLSPGDVYTDSLVMFGFPQERVSHPYDMELIDEILHLCQEEDLPVSQDPLYEKEPDHGTCVPLLFIDEQYKDYQVVRLSPSFLPNEDLLKMGRVLERAIAHTGRKASILASGDLSHKLTVDGPYGFAKEGPEFDKMITQQMKDADFAKFLEYDERFLDKAAECGLPGFIILSGALENDKVTPHFHSYEGPFGVGYAICDYDVEDYCPHLAQMSLEAYVKDRREIKVPDDLPAWMTKERAGVFVSLHKNGELRGCIGTISACTENVASEIIALAIEAGTRDPRFMPVSERELADLEYSVDVLSQAEPATMQELDAKRYGVIVTSGHKRGLLLPNLEGVDTPAEQIFISLQKAGIREGEPYQIERFTVERHCR